MTGKARWICKSAFVKTVRILLAVSAMALVLQSRESFAQSPGAAPAGAPTSSFVSVGVGAFIPLEQSYRLNYSTSVAGIPVELDGALLLPITPSLLLDVGVSYIDRKANFISDTYISSLQIEPGLRIFLEPQRPSDFRVFALAGFVISRSAVSSNVDATADGNDPVTADVRRTYLPIGAHFGLGLSYPISEQSNIDAIVRTSIFFGSPASSGGLGNIGGVSLIAAYRFAL